MCLLKPNQQRACLSDSKSVGRSLDQHAHKSELSDRAASKVWCIASLNPRGHAIVEFVIHESESNESFNIEQLVGIELTTATGAFLVRLPERSRRSSGERADCTITVR